MFSILTPTYNRVEEITRVYTSLKAQTYRDFEWIISDDGSTDGTSQLIEKWQRENLDFKIIYHRLSENKGKSYAVNEGLELCNQRYTIIADSDDTFSVHTLEDLKTIWAGIEKTENAKKVGAIWTLVQDESGELVGEPWPKNYWQVGFKERVLDVEKQTAGEKWHCWRTEVLQHYKIYTNKNSHISPGVTWNRINKKYDFLCVNLIHRTYWYTENGIINEKKTQLKIEKRNYYSAFFELSNASEREILKNSYYYNTAFKYVKASFYFKDTEVKLKGSKHLVCLLLFCWLFPSRAINTILKK